MEPTIRYAKAIDGTSIALWTLGSGEPLVYLAGAPWCHVELLQVPQCLSWYQLLSENRMLVRYDVRGTGLSDREVIDHSLNATGSECVPSRLIRRLKALNCPA